MTAQKGRDLLLKIDSDGTGNFVTVAGLRTRRLAFGSDIVDATDMESPGHWRELLSGAGLKRASIAGSGLFRDAQSDALVRQQFFDGAALDYEVTIPDFGVVTGPFQITALSLSGTHDGELAFEIALESAGALGFASL
ncbi:TP901-1 family phage major tail protein [Tepidamorphus gemmatus]|jgi:TP901-1 family phage major tail protein|uniref:TP901-1 family phage major tail protein n=1 Tax=Tepidamorphus gemmatus TaxID=747076 RepID=A0A4R3LQT7_9HYPH|nr:phage major tail protein, TP901-1 family [Tepidamorphus gemmatus]TCT02822.1 TP901-1 family phage major tail protein [Tepidamorphus gemmatus]